jgi:hypothetical protein
VSPSSSIEYAMNPDATSCCRTFDYVEKEGHEHSVRERGPDRRIGQQGRRPYDGFSHLGRSPPYPPGSPYGVNPGYILYEQGVEDPADRADASLTIGDLAIGGRRPRTIRIGMT